MYLMNITITRMRTRTPAPSPSLAEGTGLKLKRPGRAPLPAQHDQGIGNVLRFDEEIIRLVRKHLPCARLVDDAVDDDDRNVNAEGPVSPRKRFR